MHLLKRELNGIKSIIKKFSFRPGFPKKLEEEMKKKNKKSKSISL